MVLIKFYLTTKVTYDILKHPGFHMDPWFDVLPCFLVYMWVEILIQQYLRVNKDILWWPGLRTGNYFLMTSCPSRSHHLLLANKKKIKDRLIEGIAEAFLRMNSPTIAIPCKQPWIFGNISGVCYAVNITSLYSISIGNSRVVVWVVCGDDIWPTKANTDGMKTVIWVFQSLEKWPQVASLVL